MSVSCALASVIRSRRRGFCGNAPARIVEFDIEWEGSSYLAGVFGAAAAMGDVLIAINTVNKTITAHCTRLEGTPIDPPGFFIRNIRGNQPRLTLEIRAYQA